MNPDKKDILERIRESIAEIRYTKEFYDNFKKEIYTTQEEIELAQIKMQYAKQNILKKSFELKRLLRTFESHI